MSRWQILATVVAVMFGAHNLFVKRAAGRVPDVWGAFILETAAALGVLLYLVFLIMRAELPPWPKDVPAVAMVVLGGLLLSIGSILYFNVFRLGAPLSAAVPWVLTGWVVVVVALGLLLEGEVLQWRHAGGFAFAILAIWLLR